MSQEEDAKKIEKEQKKAGGILQRAFLGKLTLEWSQKHGHIIVMRGTKNIIWFKFDEFKKVVDDFSLTVESRRDKKTVHNPQGDD